VTQAPAALGIYNPLPAALAHYCRELSDTFSRIGTDVFFHDAANGEVSGGSTSRLRSLGNHLRDVRISKRNTPATLCVWPLTGWWENLVWASASSDNFVIFHDPEKLRRQFGLGGAPIFASKLAPRALKPSIITHSGAATLSVRMQLPRARIVEVRHPIVSQNTSTGGTDRDKQHAVVVGQWKPARDLRLLAELGPALRKRGWRTSIFGRGWPAIAGWDVDSRFLSEDELDGVLRKASVLVLPYSFYFQSGVAIRALENGCPVVGGGTPFLTDLFGEDYSGLITDVKRSGVWLDALTAISSNPVNIEQIADSYRQRSDQDWTNFGTDQLAEA
jgi:glycosyltransferase involved in cell wall biosynthesis